jgi:hypothetical protein
MGHNILIRNNKPAITPVKLRIDAIVKLNQPTTVTKCKSFCGMVNFLAFYLKNLQIILAPIYKLTRKDTPFVWTKECNDAFNEIKTLVTQAPVLGMPQKVGTFQIYSDTSKIGCGASLFQLQLGIAILLGYHSKKLPEACTRYSISELELTGLAINISAFKTLLSNIDFQAFVDHSALVDIIKARREPKTLRLQKLLEVLTMYSFILAYHKGKDMSICDFLSRNPDNDMDNVNEVIPIAFMLADKLQQVVTRSQTRASVPEKSTTSVPSVPDPVSKVNKTTPAVTTTRVTRSSTRKANPVNIVAKAPRIAYTENNKPIICPVSRAPLVLGPKHDNYYIREKSNKKDNHSLDSQIKNADATSVLNPLPIKIELSGHLPHMPVNHDDLVSVKVTDQDKNPPHPLFMDEKRINIIHQNMPYQKEFTKVVKLLARGSLKSYSLPLEAANLAASYRKSPYFKDIYRYVATGENPFTDKTARKTFMKTCLDYVILDRLLFKVSPDTMGELHLLLCVPEPYIAMVLYQYHDFVMAGHQGMLRTRKTIEQKFFFPHIQAYIMKYVTTCHTCQETSNNESPNKMHEIRVPQSFRPFQRMSLDVKDMNMSEFGFSKLLICTCEITNYVIGTSLEDERTKTIFNAIYLKISCDYGTPKVIISDQHPSLTSTLMKEMHKLMRTQPMYVSKENHGSNRTERYIQTINLRLKKYLNETGRNWPVFVAPCVFAQNTFVSPILGFSPYEMVYIRKPPPLSELEKDIDDFVNPSVKTDKYMETMVKRRKLISKMIREQQLMIQQTRLIREIRSNPKEIPLEVGDLIMIHRPLKGSLATNRRKISRPWIGPAQIVSCPDTHHFIVADLTGTILPVLLQRNEIKKYHARSVDSDSSLLSNLETVTEVIRDIARIHPERVLSKK